MCETATPASPGSLANSGQVTYSQGNRVTDGAAAVGKASALQAFRSSPRRTPGCRRMLAPKGRCRRRLGVADLPEGRTPAGSPARGSDGGGSNSRPEQLAGVEASGAFCPPLHGLSSTYAWRTMRFRLVGVPVAARMRFIAAGPSPLPSCWPYRWLSALAQGGVAEEIGPNTQTRIWLLAPWINFPLCPLR